MVNSEVALIWGENPVKNGFVVFWSSFLISRIKMLETNLKNEKSFFISKVSNHRSDRNFWHPVPYSDVILSQVYVFYIWKVLPWQLFGLQRFRLICQKQKAWIRSHFRLSCQLSPKIVASVSVWCLKSINYLESFFLFCICDDLLQFCKYRMFESLYFFGRRISNLLKVSQMFVFWCLKSDTFAAFCLVLLFDVRNWSYSVFSEFNRWPLADVSGLFFCGCLSTAWKSTYLLYLILYTNCLWLLSFSLF